MSDSTFDALVLGEHPSAYLVAALLRQKSKLRIGHSRIPGEASLERLVLVNPAFFELHKMLEPLKRKLDLTAYYGLRFLADAPDTESEFRSKSTAVLVGSYVQLRDTLAGLAEAEGVTMLGGESLAIDPPDEDGVTVRLDREPVRATVLIVAGHLPSAQQKVLGMPDEWEAQVLHRHSFVLQPAGDHLALDLGNRPALPMSLDLDGELVWAWIMAHGEHLQLAVSRPVEQAGKAAAPDLLQRWARVLREHGVLASEPPIEAPTVQTFDVPLAGALAHEGVADRALLVGPAGGFYSACAEDIYPNCWSAIYAADTVKKALKEPHLQDALHPYRHKWRTTLGDYLRGPQHNLRFLLPLVYKNPAMTARLAESILRGKSVVR